MQKVILEYHAAKLCYSGYKAQRRRKRRRKEKTTPRQRIFRSIYVKMDTQGTLGIKATLDISEIQKNVQKYVQNIDMMQDHTDVASQTVARSFQRMQAAGMAFLSIDMAKRLASEMVSVYGTFQQLEIKFTSMLQSGEKAQKLMRELVNFAATTPFDLKGVSQSATQLVAYGTAADDVIDRLTRLGNIAAGLSQPIGDIVYLYGTSMTQGKLMTTDLNQLAGRGIPIFEELAKVMGVNKDEIRDLAEQGKISFSYLEQVVDNLTNKGGMFFNLMQEQSKSVTGKISNLGDSIDMMFNEIGQSSDGFINAALDGTAFLIEHYKEVGTVLGTLVALYGIHKAALIAHAAYYNSIKKINEVARLTAEANALKVLETGEIKASLSKQKLVVGSTAYSRALKAEIEAKLSSQRATLQLATAEHSSAKAAYKAALQRSLAAKQAIWRRETDLVLAKAEGNQAKITLAQTELQKAIDERSAATKAKKAAAIELAQKSAAKETATTAVNTTTTTLNTAGEKANIAVKSLGTKVTNMLTVATTRLNAALVANKWTIIAIAVAAVCYGIYKLITYQTDAEKAQEKLNKRVKEFNSETEAEQAEIDRLFGKLEKAKKGTEDYKDAKDAILGNYGEYLKGMGDEIEKLRDVEAAYQAVSAAAKQAALDRAIADSTSTAQKDWAENQGKLVEKLEKAIRNSTYFQEMKGKKGIDREVSSIIQMIKGDLKSYGKLSAETQKIVDGLTMQYYKPAAKGPGEYATGNDVQFYVKRMKDNNAVLEKTYKNIHEKLGNDTNEYINLTAKQIATDIANFEAALDRAKKTGRDQIAKLHDGTTSSWMGESELMLHIRKLKEVQEQQKKAQENKAKTPDITKEVKDATDKVTKLKQEIEDLRNGKTKVEAGKTIKSVIEGKAKELKEAESALAILTGDDKQTVNSKKKKQEEDNRLKVEQAERQRQIDEMNQQEKERAIQAELELAQAKIDTMEEGFKKQQEQIDLNYRKAKANNARRAAQYVKDQQDAERKAWEKEHPKYKEEGLVFTPTVKTRNDLSQEKKNILDDYDKAAYEARITEEKRLSKSMLEAYQDYSDKRLVIEKKFNDDIAALQVLREKYLGEGNVAMAEQTYRSILQAIRNKGKGLMQHDFDVLKESPDYIRAFEDLKNTSSDTLNSLLEELETAKEIAASVLNPEDLREYTTTIQEIMDELDSRNPFKALADRQKELAEAEKELAAAKRRLDAVRNGAQLIVGVKSSKLENGKISAENIYLSEAEAIKEYTQAKDKATKANNKFLKAEKSVRETINELLNALKSVGETIGGTAGEVISLIADIGMFVTTSIDAWKKAGEAGSKALQAVERASVILSIVSAAIQLLQKLNDLGSNKAFKQYEAYAEKLKEINALTDAVNEYAISALKAKQAEESWFSTDSLKNLRDYKKLQEQVMEAYVTKASESQAIYQNESGGGWLTGAFNWIMGNLSALSWWDKWRNLFGQGDYDKGQTAAVNNLRIETRKKSSGFLGTGIGAKSQKTEDLQSWINNNKDAFTKLGLTNLELFDNNGLINKELTEAILNNFGEKLVGQTKETLEALLELREQYDEYLEQLHEYVSSLYEPLVDNLVDSLWDWLDNGKDALDSFKNYASDTFRDIVSDMLKTIVLEKVVGSFSDDIAALYEEYSKGTIDEKELMNQVAKRTKGLVNDYETNLPTLEGILSTVNGYLKDAGIDLKQPDEEASREASKKGIAQASQDSVDELNGRMTMGNILSAEIKAELQAHTVIHKDIAVKIGDIKSITSMVNDNVKIIKDSMNVITGHLANIDNHTSNLVEMRNDMHSMKQDINTILIKGMKLSKN